MLTWSSGRSASDWNERDCIIRAFCGEAHHSRVPWRPAESLKVKSSNPNYPEGIHISALVERMPSCHISPGLTGQLPTFGTGPNRRSCINWSNGITRNSPSSWPSKARPCHAMSPESLRTTSNAVVWNTGFCASAASPAILRSWSPSVANVGGYSGLPALRPSGRPSAVQNRSRRFCLSQLRRKAYGRQRGAAGR